MNMNDIGERKDEDHEQRDVSNEVVAVRGEL